LQAGLPAPRCFIDCKRGAKFPENAIGITLLGSFLVSFHAYPADMAVLLPSRITTANLTSPPHVNAHARDEVECRFMTAKWAAAIVFGIALNLFLIGPDALRSALHGIGSFPPFYNSTQPNHPPYDVTGDFPQFYIGAQLDSSRYDVDRVIERQKLLFVKVHAALMPTRLPFYYALLSPLGKLPYPAAARIWAILMIACAFAACMLYSPKDRGPFGTALAFSVTIPSIVSGQDVALVCLVLVLGLRLRRQGDPVTAGLVLSLLAIKFQLFLLVPLAFIVAREFAVLRGMLLGGTGLLILSFVDGGWDWPAKYARLLLNPLVSPGANIMPNLHGLMWSLPKLELAVTALLAAAVIYWAFKFPHNAIGITLLGSFLISFHAYSADLAVLVPVLFSVIRYRRSVAAAFCVSPLPELFLNLGYGFVPVGALAAVLAQLVFRRSESQFPPHSW
jgi:Glycosyltransferase family 87